MTTERIDPRIFDFLNEGPEIGPADGFDRAIAAVELVDQRPGWTLPERWLPGALVGLDGRPSRATWLGILVVLTFLLLIGAAFVGSRLIQLPAGPFGDVFVFEDGNAIAVAARDGSAKRVVSGNVPFGRTPVFSPDGTLIAFSAPLAADMENGLLMVVPFDGSAAPTDVGDGLVLTNSQTSQFSWSPDGARLVFSATRDGVTQLFVANADGTGSPQAITNGSGAADLPDWNSNTDLIAYRSKDADGEHINIFQIRTDGSEALIKTGAVAVDAFISRPRWRPHDNHVDDSGVPAWVLSYGLNAGFGTDTGAVIDPGMGPIDALPLTVPVSDWEGGLPWSPDGSQVAVLTEDGVVVAAFDTGSNATTHPYQGLFLDLGNVLDCWVQWSPDGQSLYGGTPGSCDHIVQVPLADPTAVQTLPMNISGAADWQPLEP